ncbi:MAG: hypothetical protein HGA23_05815, partial [Bacteroidales bacterium]|nr:hypothetical protein [Bacteroidales bacterium]
MKRSILSLIMSISLVTLFASDGYEVRYTQPDNGVHQLEFTTGNYSITDVILQGNTYSRIGFEGKIVTQVKGFAELPYLNSSVMIDPQKNVVLGIIPGEYE